jgi:hypothetical protein
VKRLKNELQSALNKVRAEEALKRKTSEFLRTEIARRKQRGGLRFCLRFAAVCAAFVLFLTVSGFSVYFAPTAHIDFDINPSVGFSVNRFGNVIDAAAYNDDGTKILQSVNINNKKYENAMMILLNACISGGYLTDNGLVSATVQANNKSYEDTLFDDLANVVNLSLAGHHINAETDMFLVDAEVMNAAHGHHMTPAKYLAITELQTVDPTATFEDCSGHSIGEIRELINVHSGEHHGGNDSDSTGQSSDSNRQEHVTNDGCEEAGHHDEYGSEEQSSIAPLQDQNSGHHRDVQKYVEEIIQRLNE